MANMRKILGKYGKIWENGKYCENMGNILGNILGKILGTSDCWKRLAKYGWKMAENGGQLGYEQS
jgi:hypothetical protein